MRNQIDHQPVSLPLTVVQTKPNIYGPAERALCVTSDCGQTSDTRVTWFDENGFDCDPKDAEFLVYGPCDDGNWHTVELGTLTTGRMQ